MGVEIERKYLVDVHMVDRYLVPSQYPSQHLVQGFLAHKPVTVRVRVINGAHAELTVKGKGTLVRPEYNYSIPVGEGMGLLKMCSGNLIEKTRYSVGPWVVDEFHGALKGLWLAEIELDSPEASFHVPEWVLAEVTEDARYTNSSLAQVGIP